MSRKLGPGSRIIALIGRSNNRQQINYGTSNDVSDETIADSDSPSRYGGSRPAVSICRPAAEGSLLRNFDRVGQIALNPLSKATPSREVRRHAVIGGERALRVSRLCTQSGPISQQATLLVAIERSVSFARSKRHAWRMSR